MTCSFSTAALTDTTHLRAKNSTHLLFHSLYVTPGSAGSLIQGSQAQNQGDRKAEIFPRHCENQSASEPCRLLAVQFHFVVGLRSPFPRWLSTNSHSQLPEPTHSLSHGPLLSSLKPATVV